MHLLPIVRRLTVRLPLVAFLAASALAGEIRRLVAQDGRTIEAEILSYKDDVLRIRRTDTKQEYRLPMDSLDAAEQERTRAFLKAHPELRETIPADALRVEFFRQRKKTGEMDLPGEFKAMSETSFSIAVTNRSNEAVKNLRAEYVIFIEKDPQGRYRGASSNPRPPLTLIQGSHNLGSIAPSRNERFDTEAVPITKTELPISWTVGAGTQAVRYVRSAKEAGTWKDQDIKGIGIRIYDGDKLVHQTTSPETLASEWAATPASPPTTP